MTTDYNREQYDCNYPDGIENTYWNIARCRTILNTVRKGGINDILDVGCGRGIVTSYLYEKGIRISGVEPGNATPIKETECPMMFNTEAAALPETARDKVRALSFFDVIEHVEDPKAFIATILSFFRNNEYLLLTVPARKELWTNFDDYYGHFRRYDLAMVREFIEDLQYQVIENRYFFHSLYFLIRINNLLRKNRELECIPPKGSATCLHALMGSIFYGERFLFPGTFVGSSIICLARRK